VNLNKAVIRRPM